MLKSWVKTGISSGFLGAVAFALFLLTAYGIYGNPLLPKIKSLDFFIYLLSITFSLLFFRFRRNDGFLHFWEGLRLALLNSLTLLLFSLIFLLILLTLIDQNLVKLQADYEIGQFIKQKSTFVAFVEQQGQDGEQIYQETLRNLHKRDWLGYLLRQEIYQKLIAGLLIALFVSAVMRNRPPEELAPPESGSPNKQVNKNTYNNKKDGVPRKKR